MRPLKSANCKTSETFLGNLLCTSKWSNSCLRFTSKVQKTGHPDEWAPQLPLSPTGWCFNIVHAALEEMEIDLLSVTREVTKPSQSWASCLGPSLGIHQKCLRIREFENDIHASLQSSRQQSTVTDESWVQGTWSWHKGLNPKQTFYSVHSQR